MSDDPQLTQREQMIVDLKCRGYTSGEIGHLLGVTDRTVEFHTKNIVQKTQARSLLHAVSVLRGWDRASR